MLPYLPETSSLSYVIAQHMSPDHQSTLVELLAPKTGLKLLKLEASQAVQGGAIYIAAPNHNVVYHDGMLIHVDLHDVAGPKPSADVLFHSLAEELGEDAIGIVLSGTGSDGAAGLRDIKAAGGVTIAQDIVSAKFDGMPKAALQTGNVDLVLRPEAIGPLLLRLVSEPRESAIHFGVEADGDDYQQIAKVVRLRTSFRLDEYKSGTVGRRIARRLSLLGLRSPTEYIAYLKANPAEAQLLVRDCFISVTSFFRDGEAYLALEHQIADIVQRAPSGAVRCWVAGCATGEEAYSIAMLFEEAIRLNGRKDLQYIIFASDLDEAALEHARAATYSKAVLDEIPKALRDRYVEIHGNSGRILKSIRNRMVFARQNVVSDPPFSRLDLVTCRNLMIYLNPPVQQRILEVFHWALKPEGHLLLGRAESADAMPDLFVPKDARQRLYARVEGAAQYTLPLGQTEHRRLSGKLTDASDVALSADQISQRLQQQLLELYAPPTLVINEADRVVYFQGDLKPYVGLPKGRAEMYLFDMVETQLSAELRALVYRCRRGESPVHGSQIRQQIDGVVRRVSLVASAFGKGDSGLLIVSFLAQPHEALDAMPVSLNASENVIISELERELVNTRNHLNLVAEELHTSNQELQSLNEELQSTNEELQTSNEEMQSTNEELLTVNEELQFKSSELEVISTDLNNVSESLYFPLLVLDATLQVTHANRACGQVFAEVGSLKGKSLNSLAWAVAVPGIEADVRGVIVSGSPMQRTLHADDGRVYMLNLMPYKSSAGKISGSVLLFEDITSAHNANVRLIESESRYRQVTEFLPQLVWTTTAQGDCDYLSPQWVQYTGISEAAQLGFAWLEQIHPDDRQRTVNEWTATAAHGKHFQIEYRIRRHDGVYRWFHTLASPVRENDGKTIKWFGSNTDIEDLKAATQSIEDSELRFRSLVTATSEIVWHTDAYGNSVGDSLDWSEFTGQNVAKESASGWMNFIHPDDWERTVATWTQALEQRTNYETEFRVRRHDGVYRQFSVKGVPILAPDGSVREWLGTCNDITERTAIERRIRDSQNRLQLATQAADIGIWEWDLISNTLQWDERLYDMFEMPDALRGSGTYYDFWKSRIHPQDLAWAEQALAAATSADTGYAGEFRIVLPGGRIRHIQMASVVAKDVTGGATSLIGINRDVTDIRETQQALISQKDHLATVFAANPNGLVVVDADGNIQMANASLLTMFGYAADELAGQSIDMLVPQERRSAHAQVRQRFMNSSEPRQMDVRRHDLFGLHKDGSTFSVEIGLAPFVSEGKSLVQATVVDVSERRQREQELEQYRSNLEEMVAARTIELEKSSNQLAQTILELQDLYNLAPCGYHSLNKDGMIQRINDTELRWLGSSREELVGKKHITALLTPTSVVEFKAIFPKFIASGSVQDLQLEFIRKDGSTYQGLLSATAFYDDQGVFESGRAVVQDYTRIKNQQDTLRSTLQSSPVAVRIARLSDNRVVFTNLAFSELV
ncbi:MAG: hypothetical protein RL032_1364, partial [Pseudomonadota bacterium]